MAYSHFDLDIAPFAEKNACQGSISIVFSANWTKMYESIEFWTVMQPKLPHSISTQVILLLQISRGKHKVPHRNLTQVLLLLQISRGKYNYPTEISRKFFKF